MSADQSKDHLVEKHARFCLALMDDVGFRDRPWARIALATAASAIRRGRLLTEDEKIENLAKSMEDDAGDTPEEQQANRETAEKLRSMIRRTESASTEGKNV